MAVVSTKITLDFTNNNLPEQVFVKQYDDLRELVVVVTNNGEVWIPTENYTAWLQVTRPDGEADAFEMKITGSGFGLVRGMVPAWATQEVGQGHADIAFLDENGGTLSTMPFELIVIESGADLESIEQNEDFGLLSKLVGTFDQIDEILDTALAVQKELIGKYNIFVYETMNDTYNVRISLDDAEPIMLEDVLGQTLVAKKLYFYPSYSFIQCETASGETYSFDIADGKTLVLGEDISITGSDH